MCGTWTEIKIGQEYGFLPSPKRNRGQARDALTPDRCSVAGSGRWWSGESLLQFGKDNDARTGLKQALDLNFDLLADGNLAVVNDNHRAVRQIADTLAFILSFANDAEVKDFAG